MRGLGIALALGLCAGVAAADVTVRSGEHPGHSRLVFDFDRLPDWQIEERRGGYDLRFDPPQGEIRLDDVFYYIPRTRLADLRIDRASGVLHLDLGCDCTIDAMVMRSRALVVDIRDPAPGEPAEEAATITAMVDGPVQLLAGSHDDGHEAAPETPGPEAAPSFPPVPETRPAAPVLPFTGDLTTEARPMGGGLTRALAEQLARAAAQGMVDPDRELWKSAGGAAPEDETHPGTRPHGEAPDNIRIRSGLDAALGPSGEEDLPAFSANLGCPNPSLYAVSSWGDERAVHVQISELRRRLVGEFDRPNRGRAIALARLYTYLTFGTEARAVIAKLLPDDPAGEALVPLSLLIETGSAGGALAPYSGCGGSLPLWALLDEDPGAPLRPVRSDAVLLAFSGLPPHLRKLLGYRVAARFAARQDFSSAEIVRAALDRISDAHDPALVLSSVHTSDPETTDADTLAALDKLAVSLHPEAAEALLLTIDGRLARNERIPLDLIDTAAALAYEMAGSAEGARVKSTEIVARFANGDFDAALEELRLAEAQHLIEAEHAEEIWHIGLARLADSEDDLEFVSHLFGDAAPGLDAAPDGLRLEMAERLLSLGFPGRAAEVAPRGATGADGLFQARLARADGDLDAAIRLAGAAEGPEARRFVAETLSAAGRHAEAQAVYMELGAAAESGAEAWRAGDWGAVAGEEAEEAERVAAAEAMLNHAEPKPAPPGPPSIEGAQSLVDQSAGLRDALTALLDKVPPPDG